ncbi:hypothetical protein KKH27_08040 [bacterium]|nr:hypothetical protein [bacterium]MBU1985188.1 hypothetical protein [bacterium]
MRHGILLALLPLVAWGQFTFAPVRLDDGLAESYYYPRVEAVSEDSLLCTWGSDTEGAFVTWGRRVAANGSPAGSWTLLHDAGGQATCPASVKSLPLSVGGEARLFYHT